MPKHSPATRLLRQRDGRVNQYYADLAGRSVFSFSEIMRGDQGWTDWIEAALLEGTGDPELVADIKELQRQSRLEHLKAQLAAVEAAS